MKLDLYAVRSSKTLVTIVVCLAIFTDTFLYGLIVPVLPYALAKDLGIPEEALPKCISILLSSFGAAVVLGSCELGSQFAILCCNLNISNIGTCSCGQI